MFYGHDPREIRDYSWRDVEAFLYVMPGLASQSFAGLFSDRDSTPNPNSNSNPNE